MAPDPSRCYSSVMPADAARLDEIGSAADEAEDNEALAEYDAKGGISHEAVMAWVRSWATEEELPPPQVGE